MFQLAIFKSDQYGIIRTMVDNETREVVFNATDVAKVLGYAAPAKAICDLCTSVARYLFRTTSIRGSLSCIPR